MTCPHEPWEMDGACMDGMCPLCLSERIRSLYSAIAHGDETHREWLREAIENHFAGQPVPPPRSGEKKEHQS